MATARTNMLELRQELDKQQIPTYHENPNSRNAPVLIIVNPDNTKTYVVVGKESFAVSEEKFDLDTSTEHKTVQGALEAIVKLRSL